MSKSSNIKTLTQPAQTDEVVQEYMDNLLADTFPEIPDNPVNNVVELAHPEPETLVVTETEVETEEPVSEVVEDVKVEEQLEQKEALHTEQKTEVIADVADSPVTEEVDPEPDEQLEEQQTPVEVEKRFPDAPAWAQEEFDVLLFEVCGLKLAVSMESLGRIIRVDHEPNHLIGRPDWFLGAYNEADNHYYVVDTAKYIMPEKGFDLSESGYEYVIQMQHSKWTLACQKLHTTVRLHPESVKWRTVKGKRPWLAGTVVDQMCALVHVDSLIEILDEAAAS